MQRVKGVTVGFYTEDWDRLRDYQDPEGWRVTDAGPNEDEDGYHFNFVARGLGGVRNVSINLTRDALRQMIDLVDPVVVATNGWGADGAWSKYFEPEPEANPTYKCCGGECCGSLS